VVSFHHRGTEDTEGAEKTMRKDLAERIECPPPSVPSVPLW
jgi:hypothetical protein